MQNIWHRWTVVLSNGCWASWSSPVVEQPWIYFILCVCREAQRSRCKDRLAFYQDFSFRLDVKKHLQFCTQINLKMNTSCSQPVSFYCYFLDRSTRLYTTCDFGNSSSECCRDISVTRSHMLTGYDSRMWARRL